MLTELHRELARLERSANDAASGLLTLAATVAESPGRARIFRIAAFLDGSARRLRARPLDVDKVAREVWTLKRVVHSLSGAVTRDELLAEITRADTAILELEG